MSPGLFRVRLGLISRPSLCLVSIFKVQMKKCLTLSESLLCWISGSVPPRKQPKSTQTFGLAWNPNPPWWTKNTAIPRAGLYLWHHRRLTSLHSGNLKGHHGLSYFQAGPSLVSLKLGQASLETLKLGVLDGSVSQRHLHGNHLHTWSVSPQSFWGFCLRGEARLTTLLPHLRYLSPHSSSSSQILHRHSGLLMALTCKAHSSVPVSGFKHNHTLFSTLPVCTNNLLRCSALCLISWIFVSAALSFIRNLQK